MELCLSVFVVCVQNGILRKKLFTKKGNAFECLWELECCISSENEEYRKVENMRKYNYYEHYMCVLYMCVRIERFFLEKKSEFC